MKTSKFPVVKNILSAHCHPANLHKTSFPADQDKIFGKELKVYPDKKLTKENIGIFLSGDILNYSPDKVLSSMVREMVFTNRMVNKNPEQLKEELVLIISEYYPELTK